MRRIIFIITILYICICHFTYQDGYAQALPLRAVWDWAMPKETDEEQREFVRFARECGFNIVIDRPTPAMADEAHKHNMLFCDILTPKVSGRFAGENPDCLQKLLPSEEAIGKIMNNPPFGNINVYRMYAHQEYNPIEGGNYLCFEHPGSIEFLKESIREKFEAYPIDGLALDFFGFQNHYACYCELCEEKRRALKERNPHLTDAEILKQFSEQSLCAVSEKIYCYVKEQYPTAVILCHIYPPFNPNPFYGIHFMADYCGQTIAWFYQPHWSLAKVLRLAEYFKTHEDLHYNRFMPFVGCYGHGETAYLAKSPDRLRSELSIALKYGEGNLMFAALGALYENKNLFTVVKDLLIEK